METLRSEQKCPFLQKKSWVSFQKQKETTENKKQTKTNKEGLGQGEVARRATSPDP